MRPSAQRARLLSRGLPTLLRLRPRLVDGAFTTVHVASFPLAAVGVRVVRLPGPEPLVRWCRRSGVAHAIVGGFFVRPDNTPLGELRIADVPVEHVPFASPWGASRACVHAGHDGVAIGRRRALPRLPRGDLLQAGPLLVSAGASAITGGDDEGFSAGAHQFDSDISAGRHPRCALALAGDRLLAVACDGRDRNDAGLTLGELADLLVDLGAEAALNLDGGGSASLVHDGALVNRPREQHGVELLEGRPIATALAITAAARL